MGVDDWLLLLTTQTTKSAAELSNKLESMQEKADARVEKWLDKTAYWADKLKGAD